MMKQVSAVDRFAALSVRTGLSLGVMRASRVADFNLMLAAAAQSFAAGRGYAESEVNSALQNWLTHEGSHLAVDHVELRRWLVDCRVLARDDYGRAYALATPAPEIAALVSALSGVDLAAVAAAARAADEVTREERRQRWAAGGRGAAGGVRGG
jgi:hypothetical protein